MKKFIVSRTSYVYQGEGSTATPVESRVSDKTYYAKSKAILQRLLDYEVRKNTVKTDFGNRPLVTFGKPRRLRNKRGGQV